MKAVIWKGVNQIEYCEVPEPECKPGWVKIKVMSAGLCSTDAHIIAGKFDAGNPPHILGHEICGDIVELGDGCNTGLLGKRVVVETYVGCGKCVFCQTGRKHLCSAGEIGYPPYAGGQAQFVVVPEGCVRIIPDNISYDEGGIMEAVACPFGTVLNSGFVMGQSVLIMGAGVAGLAFIQSFKAAGAGKILCGVRSDVKAQLAKQFGADVIIDTRKEVLSQVLSATDGVGVDISVDAAGTPITIDYAIKSTKNGGKVLLYGIPDKDEKIDFPVVDMILRQITVCGYTGNQFGWNPLIELATNGTVNIKDMVSYTFPLSKFSDALYLMNHRPENLIKIVLHPWE